MNKLLINTAQNVKFEYKLATLGSRCIAWAIDYGVIILYFILVYSLYNLFNLNNIDNWAIYGLMSLMTLPAFFYTLIAETVFDGQTLGKRITNIKVVKIDGTRATFYQYFIRWISNTVDVFLSMGALGTLSIILTQKSQRLGDLAAETTVINIKEDINLKHTLFEEITSTHEIYYPEVIKISDRDIDEIKRIFQTAYSRKNYEIIQVLAAKVELLLGLEAKVPPHDFVERVIQDHYYMFKEQ